MAITLNKLAKQCEKIALEQGIITEQSSPQVLLYDISRHWRELLDATNFASLTLVGWNEKEDVAAELIVSAVTYLQRIGCTNIERLIKQKIEQLQNS